MARKPLTIDAGMFGYRRTPAAELDGGMAEYVLDQFQTFPQQNVLAGRGFLPAGQLDLTEPGVMVFAPATPPFDVLKVPLGDPSLDPLLIEEEILP